MIKPLESRKWTFGVVAIGSMLVAGIGAVAVGVPAAAVFPVVAPWIGKIAIGLLAAQGTIDVTQVLKRSMGSAGEEGGAGGGCSASEETTESRKE